MVTSWTGPAPDPTAPFSRAQRGSAPPRLALGAGIELLSGKGDPNGVRRARKGSLYVERDAAPPALWINTDGAFAWEPVGGAVGGAAVLGFGANEGAPGELIGTSLVAWSAGTDALNVAQGSVPAIIQVPAAGTLSQLRVRQINPPGLGSSRTYTVWVNGVVTALAVTIQDLATEDYASTSVPVPAGGKVEVRVTGSVDTNNVDIVRADMQYCAPCLVGAAAALSVLVALAVRTGRPKSLKAPVRKRTKKGRRRR